MQHQHRQAPPEKRVGETVQRMTTEICAEGARQHECYCVRLFKRLHSALSTSAGIKREAMEEAKETTDNMPTEAGEEVRCCCGCGPVYLRCVFVLCICVVYLCCVFVLCICVVYMCGVEYIYIYIYSYAIKICIHTHAVYRCSQDCALCGVFVLWVVYLCCVRCVLVLCVLCSCVVRCVFMLWALCICVVCCVFVLCALCMCVVWCVFVLCICVVYVRRVSVMFSGAVYVRRAL